MTFKTDICPCGYYGTLLWCVECQTYECSKCYHGKTNLSRETNQRILQEQYRELSFGDRSRN